MRKLDSIVLIILCFSLLNTLIAQNTKPIQVIQGDVYRVKKSIPYRAKNYIPEMLADSFQATFSTYTIDIISRDWREGYPGIEGINTWFGIDFNGAFGIKEAGFYCFGIQSDDGSRLYIDGEVAIENGGMHKNRGRYDTIFLERGNHDLKVLYFQGAPTMLGMRLLVAKKGEALEVFDIRKFPLTKAEEVPITSITLADTLLFQFDEFTLSENAIAPLTNLMKKWNTIEGKWKLEIVGHTDSDGESAYNKILSQKRANAVKQFLLKKGIKAVDILAIGKGENAPLFPNNSELHKSKNRRVELIVRKVN